MLKTKGKKSQQRNRKSQKRNRRYEAAPNGTLETGTYNN